MPDSGGLVRAQVNLASHVCVYDATLQVCFRHMAALILDVSIHTLQATVCGVAASIGCHGYANAVCESVS